MMCRVGLGPQINSQFLILHDGYPQKLTPPSMPPTLSSPVGPHDTAHLSSFSSHTIPYVPLLIMLWSLGLRPWPSSCSYTFSFGSINHTICPSSYGFILFPELQARFHQLN